MTSRIVQKTFDLLLSEELSREYTPASLCRGGGIGRRAGLKIR